MHNNGISADRLRARSVVQACDWSTVDFLGYRPDQSLMVACYKYDLSAAKALACALRLLRALCKSGESHVCRGNYG
jgi:hypothetical protein